MICKECITDMIKICGIIVDYSYTDNNDLVLKDKDLMQCPKCKKISVR